MTKEEEKQIVFEGGATRGSDEILYSDVDATWLSRVEQSKISTEQLSWDSVISWLCKMSNLAAECEKAGQKAELSQEPLIGVIRVIQILSWTKPADLPLLVAETFTEGMQKYKRYSWRLGNSEGNPSIPISNWLNHAIEHLRRFVARDESEPHLAHALCNLYIVWWHLGNKPDVSTPIWPQSAKRQDRKQSCHRSH